MCSVHQALQRKNKLNIIIFITLKFESIKILYEHRYISDSSVVTGWAENFDHV